MRIAHLTPVYPPYAAGSGVACAYQAGELARRGHEVSVWTAVSDGERPGGARVQALRPLLQLGAAPLLPGLFRLPEVDVVHVHHPFIFGVEPVLWARLRHRRTAVVVSYHNRLVGSGLRRPLFYGYEETLGRLLARRADKLCVLSDAHAATISYLRTAARRAPHKLEVVPNGVDVERFSPAGEAEPRETLGVPPDATVAIHVSALDRTHFLKRSDLAIEAVARASDPKLHLVVVGEGEWRAALERSAAALGAAERVHFVGHRGHDELPRVLRAADFLILSSDLDAFPLVLLEGLSAGLPAVATDPPGVRAMVDGTDAVLLARAGDVEAISGQVARMAGMSEAERARLGASAREHVLSRYSLTAVVDRLEAVYEAAGATRH